MTYFYRKASAHDPTIDPEKFRYPGPKPQTKETAIVMLADSTEAVVRSSRDRSHERIGELVDGVIAERVTEGQFDECDLTMRDLRIIGESFKATLRGIYHPRIEYPSPTTAELQIDRRRRRRLPQAAVRPDGSPAGLARSASLTPARLFAAWHTLTAAPIHSPLIMAAA